MSQGAPADRAGERLESWKEIAAYLKRDVRTARRWEKSEGLPVHRHVHHKLATVYAYKMELDGWRARREAAEVRTTPAAIGTGWHRGAVVLGTIVVILLAVVAFQAVRRRASPAAPQPEAPVRGRLLAHATGEGQQPQTFTIGEMLYALVMSRDGQQLYASDRNHRALYVVDTGSNQVSYRFSLTTRPTNLAVSPDGQFVYSGSDEGDLLRIDVKRKTTDTLARGLAPMRDMVLTADGRRMYIAAVFNGLFAVDLRTGGIERIPTVGCPTNLGLVPGKDLLYVAYQCGGPGGRSGHDAIDVRSAGTGKAAATITGPPHVGSDIRSSPDGAQIWADGNDACISSDYDREGCPVVPGGVIHIYRADDNYLLSSIGLPGTAGRAMGISFFRDGSRAIVGGAALRVIDVRSLEVVEEAPWNAHGHAVFRPDGRRVYIRMGDRGRVAVVDFDEDRCVAPPADLAAWWSGDGHANDIREDEPGELRSGATFAPAWVGQGFRLDGRGAHVHAASLTNVDMEADFSVAAWMKPAATGLTETVFDHSEAGKPGWKVMRDADGSVSFCLFEKPVAGCAPDRMVRTKTPVRTGAWTHVVATASGRRLSLFLDGEVSNTTDIVARPKVARPDFRIGGPIGDGTFFAGVLDEVQLFRQALSIEDVRRLFGAGRFGLCYR